MKVQTGFTVNQTALKQSIQNFEEIAIETALEVLEEKAAEIETEAKRLASEKTVRRTGRLLTNITSNTKKTAKGARATVKSTAKNPKIPRKPGKRNLNLSAATYKGGVPYPRILEFSPRFGTGNGQYSRFASLYPAADLITPTIGPAIRKRLIAKYKEVYK